MAAAPEKMTAPASVSVPIPDPTRLTTEQIERGVSALKELIETRLDAMDKAIDLLQAFADKQPTTTAVDMKVDALKELHDERFRSVFDQIKIQFDGIGKQFAERDTRAEQTAKDSKIAVDAAFAAAKEAVGEQNKSSAMAIAKSEAATTKQIDQIGALAAGTMKATDDKIDDLRSRLGTIEGRKEGRGESWGIIVGAIGMAAAVVAIFIALSNGRAPAVAQAPASTPQIIYVPMPAGAAGAPGAAGAAGASGVPAIVVPAK